MSMTRRRFLVVMGSGVVGAATAQAIREWNDPARAVMPPGAVSLSHLKRSCTACGLCMSSCPSKVLVPADSCDYGRTLFGGALLPKLDFSRGACDPSCARCAEVCPAQAFLRFEHPSERARIKIGVAEWTRANCRTSSGEVCTLCSERCPKDAISLVKDEGGEVAHPKVDAAKCIGCGRCENYCPAETKAIRVKPLDPQDFAFGDETLVAYLADGTEWTSRARGVKPLLDAIDNELAKFAGARCYDRIVGRAAAFLYVKLGVAEVYAPLIAKGAVAIFRRYGIRVRFREEIAGIRNRKNDGPCPMEHTVAGIADTEVDAAIAAIRATVLRLSSGR